MAPDAKKGETAMWEQIRIGDLDGKRVLVTGGSTGIGAAVAAALAAQGARVAVHYNESAAAAQITARARMLMPVTPCLGLPRRGDGQIREAGNRLATTWSSLTAARRSERSPG